MHPYHTVLYVQARFSILNSICISHSVFVILKTNPFYGKLLDVLIHRGITTMQAGEALASPN